MNDMFDILEFCMNDTYDDYQAIQEAAETINVCEALEYEAPEVADMLYTSEAVSALTENSINSVDDLDAVVESVLDSPKGATIFAKMFKMIAA